MFRFRWLPAYLLAMLMTAGICWGQSTKPADTTRLPYYYELVDVIFPATQVNEQNFDTDTESQDTSADASDDEACDDCCADCAAEWIPILVDDCLKMWSLLWELGSYTEAANLADEAWRLDPCNISTMHARTLSHIALALNFKPTGEGSAQPSGPTAVWNVTQIGCGGFAMTCSAPTGAASCKPTNACGMTCGKSSGCCAPCATGCAGSTCAVTDCCHEKLTPCGTCPAPVCAGTNSCGSVCVSVPCATSPCTTSCPSSVPCGTCASGSCCTGPAACAACPTAKNTCCNQTNCCTKGSCACAKECNCCSGKCACAKDCKCSTSGKCCCAKNSCTCKETTCVLLEKIIALLEGQENKAPGIVVLPPGMAPHPMMAMPSMPGMCVPPPPPAAAGQPVCMPGMPCPTMLVSRPMANMPGQPTPRAPLPPGPQWVVGDILPNPPMIQAPKDDVRISVIPHGKRIHVNCSTFDATCDRLSTCDGGERIILEGKVRLTMQTGNKPGKVAAERVEVYVPDGSVELVPDNTTERPVEPVQYQCPVCPPASYVR